MVVCEAGPSSRPYTPVDVAPDSERHGRPSPRRRRRRALQQCTCTLAALLLGGAPSYAAPINPTDVPPGPTSKPLQRFIAARPPKVPPFITYVSDIGWITTDAWTLNGRAGESQSRDDQLANNQPTTTSSTTATSTRALQTYSLAQAANDVPDSWSVRRDRTHVYAVPLIIVASVILSTFIIFLVMCAVFYRRKGDDESSKKRRRKRKEQRRASVAVEDGEKHSDDEAPKDEQDEKTRGKSSRFEFLATKKIGAGRFRIRRRIMRSVTDEDDAALREDSSNLRQRTTTGISTVSSTEETLAQTRSASPTAATSDLESSQLGTSSLPGSSTQTAVNTDDRPSTPASTVSNSDPTMRSSQRADPLHGIDVPAHVDLPAYHAPSSSGQAGPAQHSVASILSPAYSAGPASQPQRSARQSEKMRAVEESIQADHHQLPTHAEVLSEGSGAAGSSLTGHLATDDKTFLRHLDTLQSGPIIPSAADAEAMATAPHIETDADGFEAVEEIGPPTEDHTPLGRSNALPTPSAPVALNYALAVFNAPAFEHPSAPDFSENTVEASAPTFDEDDFVDVGRAETQEARHLRSRARLEHAIV